MPSSSVKRLRYCPDSNAPIGLATGDGVAVGCGSGVAVGDAIVVLAGKAVAVAAGAGVVLHAVINSVEARAPIKPKMNKRFINLPKKKLILNDKHGA